MWVLSVTVCVGEWSGRHWSSVVYIHWHQVTLSLSVKVDVDVSVVSDCVCRWVKWTSLVECCLHSLTSSVLIICHSTMKVTCWLLTMTIIAFYCWVDICSCSASLLTTQTLKSSCGSQGDYVTTDTCHNSALYTTAVRRGRRGLTSSRCSFSPMLSDNLTL